MIIRCGFTVRKVAMYGFEVMEQGKGSKGLCQTMRLLCDDMPLIWPLWDLSKASNCPYLPQLASISSIAPGNLFSSNSHM
ncbi:hypothetical protein PVK06_019609 [Gossypium arboreum]|uniref:Uncharacterized protein n=1 Tax=Gossypium arboreum TaxID=29729 RepID=A0ABR0PK67_GOSAR|nr:hypothetical protein PVK06_019609 [Gossypium arboreum]